MKKITAIPVSLLLLYLLSFAKCRKEEPVEQLPPETTYGAMTFGCKVNGDIFVPRNGGGNFGLLAQYVYLDDKNGKGWFLNIRAIDYKSPRLSGVQIVTDSLFVLQDSTYKFQIGKGFPAPKYIVSPNGSLDIYTIRNDDYGELFITKHDTASRILSGRFWFDATNDLGEKVQIRDGRFDIVY